MAGAQGDPWMGQKIGEPHVSPSTASFGATGSAFGTTTPPPAAGAAHFGIDTPPGMQGQAGQGRSGKWILYDEKYITPPALALHKYDSKKPLQWLQAVRDYVSGRTSELDSLLDWVEAQTEPITESVLRGVGGGSFPMSDQTTSLIDVSKQFWALLNPLVFETSVESTFANCPRHNGLEAWRLLAEPINDDKIMVQKELLGSVMHPKPAANMDKVDEAITDWNTNIRLFEKAGGQTVTDAARRLALIDLLPPDISSYITMHLELLEYSTYDGLRRFVVKYVKVQKNLK